MRKLLSFIVVFAVLLTMCPLVSAVSGDSDDSDGKVYPLIPQVEQYYSGASQYIISELRDFNTTINVEDYKIHKDDIIEVFKSAVFSAPDIFYVDASSIRYQFNPDTNRVATITPTYIFNRSKLDSYIKKFNKAVDAFLDDVSDDWSDFKKALIIHDRIVASCSYNKVDDTSYTSYSVLVNKQGNCEGYSRAYSYLLSKVGIDTKCINSSAAAHLWTYVKIGGEWYHTDVTSDDEVPDTDGLVSHKFFLISDSKLKSYSSDIHRNYKDDLSYSSSYKCSSDKYDSSFFRSIKSQIISRGEAYYFVKDDYKNGFSSLIKRKDGTDKAVLKINTNWYNSAGSIYLANYSRLCEYKNYVFINSSRKIYRYNLNTKKSKQVFEMPSFWSNDFYGVRLSGSYIRASLKKGILQQGSDKAILKVNDSKVLQLPFLRYSSVKLKVKSKFDLKVYRGSGKTTFKSSSPKIAKVNSKGRITALKKGTATITVVKNNRTMKCKIKVVK